MNNSVFGRHIYARGGNLLAAQLSGVNTKRVDFWLFVNMGVLAASPASPSPPGSTPPCPAPAPVRARRDRRGFIGGAAVTGGIGTVTGAMIGGLIMGVLNNGMSLLGLGTEVQSFIKGFVLLFAVALRHLQQEPQRQGRRGHDHQAPQAENPTRGRCRRREAGG